MLALEWDTKEQREMQDAFNRLGADALYLSHYDLAIKAPPYTPNQWRDFLTDPRVSDYIIKEFEILKQTEMRKLLKDISGKSRSPGTAQLLNSLQKAMEVSPIKDGPVFVFCYIPLNSRESGGDNIITLSSDPFLVR